MAVVRRGELTARTHEDTADTREGNGSVKGEDSLVAEASVIFPSGMLGSGFAEEAVYEGIRLGATGIAVDAGSTDSGPHYLGTGTAKSSASAVEHDLRSLIVASRRANIPLVIGSCGTAGTDSGVDWTAKMAQRISMEEGLSFNLACIYSELKPELVVDALQRGRLIPLPPADQASAEDIKACSHIVGLMGHEPIVEALTSGADVVLAGRATDTATVAALALMRGLPPGPTWHAAKTVECGGQCTVAVRPGPVLVEIDHDGFTVTPLTADAYCTPTSVAAHMLYENADPFRLVEPSGVLDTTSARYLAIDDRRVRVTGSRFETAVQHTIKLEGSRLAGYETIVLVGIRDPHVLDRIGEWLSGVEEVLHDRVAATLALPAGDYRAELRCYGHGGVLGELEPISTTPTEVAVLLKVRARDQATATAIAKTANVLLLHMPLPGMKHLPSFAFATSPAEIERGAVYEFGLNHVIEIDDAAELVRTSFVKLAGGG